MTRARALFLRAAIGVTRPAFGGSAIALGGAAAVLLLLPRVAIAEDASARIVLVVQSLDGVDPQAVRAAIEAELGVDVVLAAPGAEGQGTLTVKGDGAHVVVSFTVDGKSIERTVDRPAQVKITIETVALIAGNLVRDQASDLLDLLRAKKVAASASVEVAVASPPPASSSSASPAASTSASATALPSPTASASPAPGMGAGAGVGAVAADPCAMPRSRLFWGVDFAPGLGSSTLEEGRSGVRTLSLGVVGTTSRGLHGAELASVFTYKSEGACGAQVAGAANLVAGRVHGAQLAGAFNLALHVMSGVQLAGGANLVAGEMHGAQLAPMNVTTQQMFGAQLGVVNLAVAGFLGAQIGVVNVSGDEARGLQLGVVNVAKDGDVPIGLVSIYAHGRTTIDVWGNETGLGMIGLEHGGRLIHNVYAVGGRRGPNGDRLAAAWGIGARAISNGDFSLDVDLMHHVLWRTDQPSPSAMLEQLRLLAGVKLFPGMTLIGGPTWSVLVTKDADETAQSPFHTFTSQSGRSEWRVLQWPGVTLGVRAL